MLRCAGAPAPRRSRSAAPLLKSARRARRFSILLKSFTSLSELATEVQGRIQEGADGLRGRGLQVRHLTRFGGRPERHGVATQGRKALVLSFGRRGRRAWAPPTAPSCELCAALHCSLVCSSACGSCPVLDPALLESEEPALPSHKLINTMTQLVISISCWNSGPLRSRQAASRCVPAPWHPANHRRWQPLTSSPPPAEPAKPSSPQLSDCVSLRHLCLRDP